MIDDGCDVVSMTASLPSSNSYLYASVHHQQLTAPRWSNASGPIPVEVNVSSYIGTSVQGAQLTVTWSIFDGGMAGVVWR